jgi:hypothetical protein
MSRPVIDDRPGHPGNEGVEASELWLALTALPRPHRTVPFPRMLPGTDTPVGELAIWPLSQEEQMAANSEADRFTKRLLKDPQQKDQANLGYHHTYSNEVAVQVLYRACRDPRNLERPAFPSPSLMRQRLSTDEVGVLFNHYCTVSSEIGPIVASMSKDEREAWILRLQEGGSAFPFDSLSWEQQRTLVLGMASQLVSCWMAMCSLGSPPDVSASTLDRLTERLRTHAETKAAESSEEPAGVSE